MTKGNDMRILKPFNMKSYNVGKPLFTRGQDAQEIESIFAKMGMFCKLGRITMVLLMQEAQFNS